MSFPLYFFPALLHYVDITSFFFSSIPGSSTACIIRVRAGDYATTALPSPPPSTPPSPSPLMVAGQRAALGGLPAVPPQPPPAVVDSVVPRCGVSKGSGVLSSANIGDSGYLVVRGGNVIHRSREQQHYFNTPFQLSLPPPGTSGHVLSDR